MRGATATRIAFALAVTTAMGASAVGIPPFSTTEAGGALPAQWVERRIPGIAPADIALEGDGAATVLRVRSQAASGAASLDLRADPAEASVLRWRWKIDRVVEKADLRRREGDDFAARVYVFFDLPEEELSFGARLRMKLARLVHGEALPAAGLCYVWDNRHARGTTAWNPYTDRIRMIVLQSGPARAGQWVGEERDLAADFLAAFGARGGRPVPAIAGIAAGNDTDQTGESATAWFGDFSLERRR